MSVFHRSVLRRVILQKLNTKKLQSFAKKFVDFEKTHGDADSLAEAEQLIEAASA